MKKERLLDICNKQKPSSNKVSRHDDQKHKVPVRSTMSSSNKNADETNDVTQQPVQANGKGNFGSDLLREFGMLSSLESRNFLDTKYNVCTLNKVDKCMQCYLCGVEGQLTRRCPTRSK